MKEAGLSTFLWSIPGENAKNLNKQAIIDLIRFIPTAILQNKLFKQLYLPLVAIPAGIYNLGSSSLIIGTAPANHN
jgi:hypothetical protein